MPRTLFRSALFALLATAVVGSTVAVVRGPSYAFFDPLIDLKAAISERFVDAPDEAAMQAGAMKGMLDALNDPYTFYVPRENTREFSKGITGEYVGIGVSVLQKDGWLTVVTPLEDSPAFDAGIQADDRIIEIEGKSTLNLDPDAAVTLLAGAPNTEVNIVIERAGRHIPMKVKRQTIVTRTVKGFHRDGPNGQWNHLIDPQRRIAYIRLTQFNATSLDEFNAALASVHASATEGPDKLGGLVIDLRGDPGGLLTTAIGIADLFLKDGVIVSTRGRTIPEQVNRATEPGTLPDFPIAILIDGQSASASEILSAALVENNRAIAVGSRSFGKGSVQSVMTLPTVPGGELKVTEQRYYTPSGRCLHRLPDSTQWGVDPTVGFYIPVNDQERIEALKARRDEEIIRDRSNADSAADWSNPDWIVGHLKDSQLGAALKAVQGKVDTGEWKATGKEGIAGDAILLDELSRIEGARQRLLRELTRLQDRQDQLEAVTKASDVKPPNDLWPDETDITGGEVTITDKDGKPITRLRITGADLERWLMDAPVESETKP